MSRASADRRRTPAVVATLALVAAGGLVALNAVSSTGRTGELTYLAIATGTAAAAWIGARRAGLGGTAALIALGVILSAGGDLIWQLYAWSQDQPPDVSIADLGWLGAYVAVGAALLSASRNPDRGARQIDHDGLVDIAVVALLAMVVQWELSLQALVTDDTTPMLSRFIWALYPTCDAILLALVVRAMVTRRLRGFAGWAIAAGVVCWLAADFAYTLFQVDDTFAPWMNAGWLLGAVMLAAAAWSKPAPRSLVTVDRSARGASYGGILVALVPLLVPGAVAVVQHQRGVDENPVLLYVTTVALIGLGLVRASCLLRAERSARDALTAQQRYARAIAMNSSDAVMVLDAAGTILENSPQLAELMGEPGAAMKGRDSLEFLDPVDLDMARAILGRSIAGPGQTFEADVRVASATTARWLGGRIVNLLDDPDVGGLVVNLHDITARKQAQDELAHQALHDRLTGLANRALFVDRVEQALRLHLHTSLGAAVIFLDLDGFKTVNDSLGHGAGDALLIEVTDRLLATVGAGVTVARLGGDEFAVLIEHSEQPLTDAQAVAEHILRSLEVPIALDTQSVSVSASIGIAVARENDPVTTGSLLRDADIAMYRAKAAGKSRWVVYDSAMRTADSEQLRLEVDLVHAGEQGQFALEYQPVVELATERLIGFEALIRWHHPTFGVVAPDRFIPIAEQTGQIIPIGRWVLGEACRTAARWQRAYPGLGRLSMAVNVAAGQIMSPDLTGEVAAALDAAGLDAQSLVLEMTETTLVQDTVAAAQRLRELRELGIRVAIDDFGTGYSSLSYLRQFPVDILKIDRSFIDTIGEDGEVPPIVRGILDLGRTLDLQIVAEGVELEVQRDELRRHGCEFAQGFLFSRPLGIVDAELLLLQLSVATDARDLSASFQPTPDP